jgi:hypothetical protein
VEKEENVRVGNIALFHGCFLILVHARFISSEVRLDRPFIFVSMFRIVMLFLAEFFCFLIFFFSIKKYSISHKS